MEILVNSRQMKQCDKNTIEKFCVPSLVLMERAALGVAGEIEKIFTEEAAGRKGTAQICKKPSECHVLCVCGTGNNGGDGLAIGRILWQKGYQVAFVMPPNRDRISVETRQQMDILEAYGLSILDEIPSVSCDVIVDALFGIGLTRNLEGVYQNYVQQMNQCSGWKIAVDIPSGIHADTGAVMGNAFRADMTVTFAYAKTGLLLYPGADYAGKVQVKDIGIDVHSFLEEQPHIFKINKEDLQKIPKRADYSNKGSFGKVLTVAGHKNMAGAAFLSAKASYVTGTGIVKILTEEANRMILQQLLPEAILSSYEPFRKNGNRNDKADHEKNEILQELSESISWASVIVLGPGIGREKTAEILVKTILQTAEIPIILDADGLNIVSEHLDWLKHAKAPIVVTPHLGEMARLVKKSIFDIQKQLLQVAQQFAEEYNVICVLKDARTITALPDGTVFLNTSGNSGMATAGAGDVLTGILAGLIAQGMKPEEAAPVGVYLHGAAAAAMLEETGTYGLMAQDIIKGISKVIRNMADKK